MDYKVNITRQAYSHLKEIHRYISEILLAPAAAKRMLILLQDAVLGLNYMPERHPLVSEEPWSTYGVRRLIMKNFYVYFNIDESDERVDVLGIIYGRRDQLAQLEAISDDSAE